MRVQRIIYIYISYIQYLFIDGARTQPCIGAFISSRVIRITYARSKRSASHARAHYIHMCVCVSAESPWLYRLAEQICFAMHDRYIAGIETLPPTSFVESL